MNTPKLIAACALFISATATFAHDVQGLSATHWHAGDAWPLLAVAAMIAVAAWLSSR